jgi:hypothetical protein
MGRNIQFGAAIVMMLVVITSAPALVCVGYFAQDSHVHECCPSPSAPEKVVTVCCVQSPAVTTQLNIQVFGTELSGLVAVSQSPLISHESFSPSVSALLSPPGGSPVLRI